MQDRNRVVNSANMIAAPPIVSRLPPFVRARSPPPSVRRAHALRRVSPMSGASLGRRRRGRGADAKRSSVPSAVRLCPHYTLLSVECPPTARGSAKGAIETRSPKARILWPRANRFEAAAVRSGRKTESWPITKFATACSSPPPSRC